jgi:hypothetical protein
MQGFFQFFDSGAVVARFAVGKEFRLARMEAFKSGSFRPLRAHPA